MTNKILAAMQKKWGKRKGTRMYFARNIPTSAGKNAKPQGERENQGGPRSNNP